MRVVLNEQVVCYKSCALLKELYSVVTARVVFVCVNEKLFSVMRVVLMK